MKRRTHKARGFSLLELLLALAMSTMLALALYLALSIGLRAQKTVAATMQPMRAVTVAADLVKQDLQSVMPPAGVLAGPFIGLHQADGLYESDFVSFHALGGDPTEQEQYIPEGIRRIELELRTDVTPAVLVRRVTRNLLPFIEVEPEEEVLCRGVRSFRVRYFDGYLWQDEWDSTLMGDVLPSAVEIAIELESGLAPDRSNPAYSVVCIVPLPCSKPAEELTAETGGAP